ncbi:MAG: signal peptidase II [Candidatus Woesearchaeota archaeon]
MAIKTPKGRIILFWTAVIVIILDIATKVWVRSAIPANGSFDILPFLSITHVQNPGVAFGLLQFASLRWVYVAVALAVAIIIANSCRHNKLKSHFLLWGLIMGGALGNALDRIFIGTVTDFIDFHFWPAFNIADSALTIGIVLLIIHAFRKEE